MAEKKDLSKMRRRVITAALLVLVAFGAWHYARVTATFRGPERWIHIPADATAQQAKDSIRSALEGSYGETVAMLWDGDVATAHGAYRVGEGDRAWRVARRLSQGNQTPVKVTFNNARTLADVADKVSLNMEFTSDDFLKAFRELAAKDSISQDELAVELLPDTYEAYWSATPESVLRKMQAHYAGIWTDARKEKASELGLTPMQVSILASIVAEESNKSDEWGKIARLYLNRLHRGIPLQADPTVKFAVGDFSIKRITAEHLQTDSPYNTYRREGLPPGIIRFPDLRTIDAVLKAPAHDHIYMCARADLSGYHDFTSDYSKHLANAAAFRKAAYGK